LDLLGQSVDIETADGVSLHDTSDLRADLERYLSQATPLRSCDWCLGTSGETFPHHQLGREERVRELSARPELEGLVRLRTLKEPSAKPLG
jgi:hypothetical protein